MMSIVSAAYKTKIDQFLGDSFWHRQCEQNILRIVRVTYRIK